MITATELRNKLEAIMDMITGDYSPAQWDLKNEIDIARYRAAKKVYEEAEDAIYLEEVDWDNSTDEDYEAIGQFIGKLRLELDMMEEDLNIY